MFKQMGNVTKPVRVYINPYFVYRSLQLKDTHLEIQHLQESVYYLRFVDNNL